MQQSVLQGLTAENSEMGGINSTTRSANFGAPANPEQQGATRKYSSRYVVPEAGLMRGGMAIDVDEAGHGLGTIPNLFKGSTDSAAPMLAPFAAIALAVLPLVTACLAIFGGAHECKDGLGELHRLGESRAKLRQEMGEPIPAGSAPSDPTSARPSGSGSGTTYAGRRQRRLHEIGERVSEAKSRVVAGFASVGAGLAMLGKGVLDLAAMATPALPAAAGAASTLVLGPLAAVATVVMGSTIVRSSWKAYRNCMQAIRQPEFHATLESWEGSYYLRFLNNKATKRSAFLSSFLRWSGGFLTGAVVFTAAMLVTTGIAIGGPFALLAMVNPVVLTVVTTVGAIGMTVGSMNFVLRHGRNKRYQALQEAKHPLFDRKLAGLLDQIPPEADNIGAGMKYRVDAHAGMMEMDTTLGHLLKSLAKTSGKRYNFRFYPSLPDPKRPYRVKFSFKAELRDRVKALPTELRAAGSAIARFASELRKSFAFQKAWGAALDRFAQRRTSLSVRSVAQAIARSKTVESAVSRRLMFGMFDLLSAQRDFWLLERNNLNGLRTKDAEADAWILKRQTMADEFCERIATTRKELGRNMNLSDVAIVDFLTLQSELGLTTFDPKGSHDAQLAKFLVKDLPASLKTMRGVLFDSALAAARDLDRNRPAQAG